MKLVLFTLLLFPLISFAQNRTFSCDYKTWSDEKGTNTVKKEFKLVFIVDDESGNSYMLGNNGTTKVIAIEKTDQISFIEVSDTGNVMTTSITKNTTSVHSRNTIILGEIAASQYYGSCELQ